MDARTSKSLPQRTRRNTTVNTVLRFIECLGLCCWPAGIKPLSDLFAPSFEILFHQGHELIGDGAVDEAVIVTERQMHDGANRNGITAIFVGDYHRLLRDSADAHDGGVRLVDDGKAKDGAKLARIGDGEGGTFDVVGLELLVARALAKIGDAALQAEKVQVSRILHDGNDQAPVESDRYAHVDLAVIADVIAFNRRVDDRPLLKGDDGGAYEEGHEGQAGAVALLESGFLFIPQIDDAGEIHLVHAVHVSAGASRLDHVLGDQLAHVGQGDQVAGIWGRSGWNRARCGWRGRRSGGRRCTGRGGWRRLAFDEGQDVLFGDAATESGSGNLRKTDSVFPCDFADQRRGSSFFFGFVFVW